MVRMPKTKYRIWHTQTTARTIRPTGTRPIMAKPKAMVRVTTAMIRSLVRQVMPLPRTKLSRLFL